jgi:hypothetical protein
VPGRLHGLDWVGHPTASIPAPSGNDRHPPVGRRRGRVLLWHSKRRPSRPRNRHLRRTRGLARRRATAVHSDQARGYPPRARPRPPRGLAVSRVELPGSLSPPANPARLRSAHGHCVVDPPARLSRGEFGSLGGAKWISLSQRPCPASSHRPDAAAPHPLRAARHLPRARRATPRLPRARGRRCLTDPRLGGTRHRAAGQVGATPDCCMDGITRMGSSMHGPAMSPRQA